jgi:hypothetical protein
VKNLDFDKVLGYSADPSPIDEKNSKKLLSSMTKVKDKHYKAVLSFFDGDHALEFRCAIQTRAQKKMLRDPDI